MGLDPVIVLLKADPATMPKISFTVINFMVFGRTVDRVSLPVMLLYVQVKTFDAVALTFEAISMANVDPEYDPGVSNAFICFWIAAIKSLAQIRISIYFSADLTSSRAFQLQSASTNALFIICKLLSPRPMVQ